MMIYFFVKFFTRLIACSYTQFAGSPGLSAIPKLATNQGQHGGRARSGLRVRCGGSTQPPATPLSARLHGVSARADKLKLAAHGAVGGNTRPDKLGLCCTDTYPSKYPSCAIIGPI
jgi:hypothetical protein